MRSNANLLLNRCPVIRDVVSEIEPVDPRDRGEKPADGRKVVKAQGDVRMYENMIQSLGKIPALAGLEDGKTLAACRHRGWGGDFLQCVPILLHRNILPRYQSLYLKVSSVKEVTCYFFRLETIQI